MPLTFEYLINSDRTEMLMYTLFIFEFEWLML